MSRLEEAKKQYAALGIDVDAAIEILKNNPYHYIAGKAMMLRALTKTVRLPAVFKPRVTTPAKHAHLMSLWQIWIWLYHFAPV